MSVKPAIEVRGLAKQYTRGMGGRGDSLGGLLRRVLNPVRGMSHEAASFWALQDVSFIVPRGQCVGLIGRNGAGKSTLLKILARIVYPTLGEAVIRGRVASLIEVGTGFNPELSGRENVFLNASLYGMSRQEVAAQFEEIVEFSGVRDFIDSPVKHYSSGMSMRLAFSVAAHLNSEVLLLDEVLAVGDLSFQQKCLNRVESLASEGRTVLFVSHNIDAVVRFCSRCIWLEHGQMVQDGDAKEVVDAYVQAVMGTSPIKQWDSEGGGDGRGIAQTEAPGDDHVRLLSVRVTNGEGGTVQSITVDMPVGIEVSYEILREGKNIQPALQIRTATDTCAFAVAYTDSERMAVSPQIGRYRATAWIPPNLLNVGVTHVTVVMATPDPLERHCSVDRAVSFHVMERFEAVRQTARGLYGREFPGVVRPKLQWDTQVLR